MNNKKVCIIIFAGEKGEEKLSKDSFYNLISSGMTRMYAEDIKKSGKDIPLDVSFIRFKWNEETFDNSFKRMQKKIKNEKELVIKSLIEGSVLHLMKDNTTESFGILIDYDKDKVNKYLKETKVEDILNFNVDEKDNPVIQIYKRIIDINQYMCIHIPEESVSKINALYEEEVNDVRQ